MSQIDTTFSANNWYLHHKNTYGNKTYVFQRGLIYYLIVTTLAIISFLSIGVKYYHIAQFIDSIFYSVSLFVTIYTYNLNVTVKNDNKINARKKCTANP